MLVDDDRGELRNRNRQLLHRTADIGRPKVEVAAEALAAFNPGLDLHVVARRMGSAADIAALLQGADLLIERADWPPYSMKALHHLTGLAEPATLGTSIALDLGTLEVTREPLGRRPDCPVGGDVT